jgi:isopentenyl-diphosphate delta-isomerase
MERVILVDERDCELGVAEKMRAHAEGLLHRAFSVFVFDRAGRLLLQRRALSKYHSGGLWSNTCCGHPRPGETVAGAARRRLAEEMSFVCELRPGFEFLYRAELGNGLTEYEYDHVLVGSFDGEPRPDPSEVGDWRWVGLKALRDDLDARPESYSYWLRVALESEGWPRLLAA